MMKTIFLILAVTISFPASNSKAQSATWQWQKSIGGPDDDDGIEIVTDANGNTYTTGVFEGTVDFDPGPAVANLAVTSVGAFVCKLDSAGNFVWAKQFGGSGTSNPRSIRLDSNNNVCLTGYFYGTVDFDPGPSVFNLTIPLSTADVFVCELDSGGNFKWAKAIGGSASDYGQTIAIDRFNAGSIYVAGTFKSIVDFDPGPGIFNLTSTGTDDAFIVKLDSQANFIWAKAINGLSFVFPRELVLDEHENIFLTGYFYDTTDFDPGPLVYNLTSPTNDQNTYILKLDSAGNFIWANSFKGTYENFSSGIVTDATGNGDIYITGEFEGTIDFNPGPATYNLTSAGDGDIYITKLDSAGNFNWAKKIGGTFWDQPQAILMDSSADKNIYLAGIYTGNVDFDPGLDTAIMQGSGVTDIFVCKFDSSGNFAWALNAGGGAADYGRSLSMDAYGNLFTTGTFESDTLTFGQDFLINTAAQQRDIFIAKIDTALIFTSYHASKKESSDILLLPNPASTKVTVYSGTTKPFEIIITDIAGKIVYKTKARGNPEINTSGFDNAVYMVKVYDNDGMRCKKLFISR